MSKQQPATQLEVSDAARIPSNYSRLIARVLGLQARDLPLLLTQTGLSANQLVLEDTLLTSGQQIQVLENALQLSDDEMFGLRLGQRLTPATHGAVGFMASSSPNLLVALRAFQTYLPTRIDFLHLGLERSLQDWECSCYFDIDLDATIQRVIAEALVSALLQCAEFVIGRPAEDVQICFTFPEPEYSERYQEFLPGQIKFSSPNLALKMPQALCSVPNASANHESFSVALQHCQSILAQLPAQSNDYTHRVQKLMLSHPPGVLVEEEAAAALFISKRTLARKLKIEGQTFRNIRDEILAQQASNYLRESRMSVETVAALLGYHDSSSFRRAFKRWFRLTPDQFRKQSSSSA